MGIKSLNRYFMDKCSKQSIRKMQLRDFAGKTLVVDTSIYLYKFAADDAIIENMFQMISIFKKYNIEPIFVFDGKPPSEKKGVLMQRRLEKREAQQKYNALKYSLDDDEEDEAKRKRLLADMEALKKQFIRIKESDVINVKRLMCAYGVSYYHAIGEADVLCCYLVKTGRAWACVSDDMDMFVYGCERVVRHLSMLNHTAIFYDTERILREINMTEDVFRDIMVLSGTDYNMNNETNLVETLKWFNEYNRSGNTDTSKFYEWLLKNTRYIKDINGLLNIKKMFEIESHDDLLRTIDIDNERNTRPDNITLKGILSDDGFIFA
jgi:flap endonuclease-1